MDNIKSSSEIVDELLKELARKNFQDNSIKSMDCKQNNNQVLKKSEENCKKIELQQTYSVKDRKRRDEKKSRKHKEKRSRSSDEESSREKRRHHKKKKKKSEESRKKHKHKRRRSKDRDKEMKKRKSKEEEEEEIEWESDSESKQLRANQTNSPICDNVPEYVEKIDAAKNLFAIETQTNDIEETCDAGCEINFEPKIEELKEAENQVIQNVNSHEVKGEEKKIVCIVKDEWGSEVDESTKSRIEIKDLKDSFVLQGTACPEKKTETINEVNYEGEMDSEDDSEEEEDALDHSKPPKKLKSKHRTKRSKESRRKSSDHSRRRRSKSRSISRSRRKSRSRSRSKSRRKSRSRSKSKRRSRSRSKSNDRKKYERRHSLDERVKYQRNLRHKSDSCDKTRRKSRSPTRDGHEKIDKAKLLEIARKNAMMMVSQGQITPTGRLIHSQQNAVALKAGGKSVAELTNFCKQLVKQGDSSSSDEENSNGVTEEENAPFIQHPFKLKDPQPNIVMNIKNAVQVPIKTPAEKAAETAKLRIQFPVSSGSQHRKKESEWVPVSPSKETAKPASSLTPPPTPAEPVVVEPAQQPPHGVDVATVVSQRLKAVKKLEENPNDVEALSIIFQAQQQLQSWAESKQLPGLFTGSTNARLLTPEELAGPAHSQAWVKKDQFNKAPPVDGGMGMYLLRKMGWNPGEGLGKNKEGVTLPLMLDIKMDKKGLTSAEETARKNSTVPVLKDLSGKHPVSALVELCSKRKWGPPDFILIHDSGPDHKKNFLFKVRVNSIDYQPTIASSNKKHAKAQAAIVCLQALGLYPRDLNNPL